MLGRVDWPPGLVGSALWLEISQPSAKSVLRGRDVSPRPGARELKEALPSSGKEGGTAAGLTTTTSSPYVSNTQLHTICVNLYLFKDG
jgi:hypothetical protein